MMKKAFTLIELLTVMAITAVLLTLIVLPIFQSFNLTRAAQAFADAQDKGRTLTDRIARETGEAVSVRDAASTVIQLPAIDPVTRKPKNDGTVDENVLPFTKLDLVPPAQGDPSASVKNPDGSITYRDPATGKLDPTLTRPKGDVNLQVVPGATIVRWFVGLRDPLSPYNEPYTGLLMARNGTRDNLFVLRRAEVQPFVYRLRKDGSGTRKWRPNLAYFRSDDDRNDGGEWDTRIIDYDDPRFFIADGKYLPDGLVDTLANRQPDPEKNNRVARWAGLAVDPQNTSIAVQNAVSRDVVIQTEVSRYDMIRPVVVGSPPQPDPNAPVTARVVPLVQFRPTRVANEPAAGSAAARPGEAVDGLDRIGPDTYRTTRGLWTDAIVRYYPAGYMPTANAFMEVASVAPNGNAFISLGVPDASGLDQATGPALFDLNGYERSMARGDANPFTASLNAASLSTEDARRAFTPFRVLTATGKIVTSFPIEQIGTSAVQGSAGPNLPHLPRVLTLNAMTPVEAGKNVQTGAYGDPGLTSAPLSPYGTTGYEINRAFNRVWNEHPDLQGSLQRFLDLRFVPLPDGSPSPLNPIYLGGASGFAFQNVNTLGWENRVRIVPGSDEVYAPDQNPGPGYGAVVRYTRVTGNPGPNQYRLVYADLPEPTVVAGSSGPGQVSREAYQNLLGLDASEMGTFDPTQAPASGYQADNVASAVIQPRFKAGYLQFDSDPNVPLPAGPVTVRYRFQMNGPADTFAVDLDTREIMQILLTIKNYPQSNAPNAQTVTLKSTATLRNALR